MLYCMNQRYGRSIYWKWKVASATGVVCDCVKAPIHYMLNGAVKLCKKNCTTIWTECSPAQHSFPTRFVSFFCQFCRVPSDDAIVVSAGKLRKLWDSLSELRSSLCESLLLGRTVLRPELLPVKTAQFAQFSVRYDVTTVQSLSLTGSVYGALCFRPAVSRLCARSSSQFIRVFP
jgi:hypothetical protein